MLISVINLAQAKIADADLQKAIRAINLQIAEDFEPYWQFGARLRLEGPVVGKPDKKRLDEMRGDAILYLWDAPKSEQDDALGYHDSNFKGIPFGFVFPQISKKLSESWTVTLSHEALELLADSQANLLVQGPHPEEPKRLVYHWFEMCDAVQDESYEIDGIEVSNFVLPLYFTPDNESGSRNDFLGTKNKGKTLESFGVNKGGYIGFFDPEKKKDDYFYGRRGMDARARKRFSIKTGAGFGRRALRISRSK
jgi:hypothetical protein